MACIISNGISGVCEYSSSGIEKIWLANKSEFTGDEYDGDLTLTGLTVSGVTYEFVPALDSGTFNDDLVVNGSRRNFLQTINFGLNSVDAATLAILEDLGLSNMIAFVKSADGSFRAFGLSGTGLRATVITEASGTSTGNDGAIAVTIAGSTTTKARFVIAALATTLGLS